MGAFRDASLIIALGAVTVANPLDGGVDGFARVTVDHAIA